MSWDMVLLANSEYESRLRKAEEGRLADRAKRSTRPASLPMQRLRLHLGYRLVAWGTALQTPADISFHELTATQPK